MMIKRYDKDKKEKMSNEDHDQISTWSIVHMYMLTHIVLRYEFCPIFINEKMRKKHSNVSEKVWNHQYDVDGKSELWEREMSKRMENKEKSEKRIKKIRKRKNFGFGGSWLWPMRRW